MHHSPSLGCCSSQQVSIREEHKHEMFYNVDQSDNGLAWSHGLAPKKVPKRKHPRPASNGLDPWYFVDRFGIIFKILLLGS